MKLPNGASAAIAPVLYLPGGWKYPVEGRCYEGTLDNDSSAPFSNSSPFGGAGNLVSICQRGWKQARRPPRKPPGRC